MAQPAAAAAEVGGGEASSLSVSGDGVGLDDVVGEAGASRRLSLSILIMLVSYGVLSGNKKLSAQFWGIQESNASVNKNIARNPYQEMSLHVNML